MTIKARQIHDWAEKHIDARTHLSVLLRKLVNSTATGLRRVDFPGYDNAQRKGYDGFVESDVSTPWIPVGSSYWEFGTDKGPLTKANDDYKDILAKVSVEKRTNSTFVFVTPRNWTGKTKWEEQKNNAKDWKAVRAYDASDLEQWIEQSAQTQIWFAEQLDIPVIGFETLEQAWQRWTNATEPHLTSEIFTISISSYRDKFKEWLCKPSEKSLVIAADSRDEALAFLFCMFDDEEFIQFKDLTAVFSSPEILRKFINSQVSFIPIVYSEDVEIELSDAYSRRHCIVFHPRNSAERDADITLDLLSHEAFEKVLTGMGINKDNVDRLARESGYSPTILRRRLSKNQAIKKPEWSRDDLTAKMLVPLALIGAWHVDSEADCEIVSVVAGREYEAIEEDIMRLLQLDDSPIWAVRHHRGVVSKIDAIFGVERLITQSVIDRFFSVTDRILTEPDPSLDLPEKDRWAASLYGKKREYSDFLRESICDTLILLSVYGNNFFKRHIGIDIESRVSSLIRKLLTPLTIEKLLSNKNDLLRYAEAAPDEFLKIIEADLNSSNPIVYGLLKPVEKGSFWSSPSRTGLLWALECLAWKSRNLSRVSIILSKLSRHKIEDNWMNKPDASLQSIFRSWMPQTSASVEQRMKILEMLTIRFPEIAWEICLEQIKSGTRFGENNYRPRWRNDAYGAGQVVTHEEMFNFNHKALCHLLSWESYDEKTLGDLIELIHVMPENDQIQVWNLIDDWSKDATQWGKALLRERIRRFAFTRHDSKRKPGKKIKSRASMAYDSLCPTDPVARHSWLFKDQWVQESLDELEDDNFDYDKYEEKVDILRRSAIAEIWNECGFDGVEESLLHSNSAEIIGQYMSSCITGLDQRVDFIRKCLFIDVELRRKANSCLGGFLIGIGDENLSGIFQSVINELSSEDLIRLFVCAPFKSFIWRQIDCYGKELRTEYWKSVNPYPSQYTASELDEIIDNLLSVQRPRAAFYTSRLNFDGIDTPRLKQLLHDMAAVNSEPADSYKIDRYKISKALDSLEGRKDITIHEMAQLELTYIEALGGSDHGIPNLEDLITKSPDMFVQALSFSCKHTDTLLYSIKRIPGTDENGNIDTDALITWIAEVRRLCREYGRIDIGDHFIGQLLSNSPVGENGVWPCEAICEAMEKIESQEIANGFCIGVHLRKRGGVQERELEKKYRVWADHLHFCYPYVGGILESIAARYKREAEREDFEEIINKRLGY